MPVFEYRAVQPDGKIAEGQLEADRRPEAFRQIDTLGLRPIRVAKIGGATNTAPAPSASRRNRVAWVAAGLFLLSLFLPAVNLIPWLAGFRLLVLSFFGTVFFGCVALVDGAKNADFPQALGDFGTCFVGASANVLMLITFLRIIRGRRVPVPVPALSLALTLVAAGALCYRFGRSIDETVSFGYFAWVGSAAFLTAAAVAQRAHLKRGA